MFEVMRNIHRLVEPEVVRKVIPAVLVRVRVVVGCDVERAILKQSIRC
jgi:hypothetical protein